MKKYANRMGLVFAVAAVCLTCCLISLYSSQKPGVESPALTTLADLRRELGHVQMLTLPVGGEPVVVDGGEHLFEPAPGDLEASLLLGALLPQESGGRRSWPVILVEDPASRDTIILDAEGGEVVRLPCDPGYDPGWALDILSPLPQGFMDATAYDPAKVALAMRLIQRQDGPAAANVSPVPDTKANLTPVTKAAKKTAEANAKNAPEARTGGQAGESPDPADAAGSVASAVPAPDGQVMAAAFSDGIDDTDGDGLSDAEELGMGKVVAWGQNTYAQGSVPATASNAIAVAAGYTHNLALRQDGSVFAWGQNSYAQCTVPASASNVVTIAAGAYHSLARRADGAVIAWGRNTYNQCTVPALASNAVALTAGMYHSAALRTNGTVVAWGQNTYAQCTVPAAVTNVVSVSSGNYHNLALRANGSVVAWGQNSYGQCTVPAAATNVVAIAAGGYHSLALRSDGSVLAWGRNTYQQCTVPASATNAVALGAGEYFSFAINANGRVTAWGQNTSAQCSGATNYSCVGAVSGGADHGLAIRRPNPLKSDTDSDTMTDGWEVVHGFDPLNGVDALLDADGDGLSNLAEFQNSTDPRDADSDHDTLSDSWEVNHGLNALDPADAASDTDGDGLTALAEFLNGTDPRDADTDNDAMPDGWEAAHNLAPLDPVDAGQDADTDGLTNLAEYQRGTDPRNADTDGDSLPDGWEVSGGLDPLDGADARADADGDDFSNLYEYFRNSSPTNALSLPQPSLYVNAAATNSGNGTFQQPFKTLRSALQAAADYAIIQVADGVYTGADNKNLSFLGKPVMLLSEYGAGGCVIDCQGLGTGVLFENNEDARSVLRGLTVRNGGAEGGAVRCVAASPLIQACRFESNGQPGQPGGAIYNLSANPTLENCVIVRNSALNGGGIYNDDASPLIRNCTLSGNAAVSGGAALYNADTNSRPVMINSIVWGNGPAPLAGQGLLFARHSVIEGGVISSQIAPGSDLANSGADPRLTPACRLMADSPCIDAGMSPAPLRDIDGEARYDVPAVTNGAWIVDIGADEFVDTDEDLMADGWEMENLAALSRDGTGDFDGDGVSDRDEYLQGCHPAKRDSDGDGMPDAWELSQGLDPRDPANARLDADSDGLNDLEEFRAGTDPKDPDTDKDGLTDYKELRWSRIMAWGTNNFGQCAVPSSLTNALAIAVKGDKNFALLDDGTLVSWPQNTVTNAATNIVSFAAGGNHYLALRPDGSVVAWGNNTSGQCTIPATASNAVALAAGMYHSLALRPNGTVVAWGNNGAGQCTVPASATNVIAIAAGDNHSLALRANGTVVAWGENYCQQCYVPATATNIVAIAAGPFHNLAIRSDGRVIAWGAYIFNSIYNISYGQCTVPPSATSVVAVAVGTFHSLALRKDGKVIAWGLNDVGQCAGATDVSCAVSIASGPYHSIALSRMNPLKGDTDGDRMLDGWELSYDLDPVNAADASGDADGDGLTNLAEFSANTDPRETDTDGDNMTDGWELAYGFNPLNPEDGLLDTDGDGLSDAGECLNGTNPKSPDTDGDTMPDGWEVAHGLDPLNPADGGQDADGDGATNLLEFAKRSDPRNADTDGDTMPDGWELAYGLNVLNPEDATLDLDMDGILNRREYEMGSDPSAGYFLKESFDSGIPSDWMNSTMYDYYTGGAAIASWMATPSDAGKWLATWGSTGYNLPHLPCPKGNTGLNVGISFLGSFANNKYGASSLMTPWMNLGKGMTNAVLSFYFCNPSLYTYETNAYGDYLDIYCRSRTRNAAGLEVIDVQPVARLGEYPMKAAQYWKRVSVRLPNPSEDCQVVFVYYSSGSHIGVYVDEVSITGDYGRVSQDALHMSIATPSALPSASRGIPYTTRLSVRGGLRPFLWHYQWSVVSNALPEGLVLDMHTGVISGTPATLGPCSFSIEAKSEYGKAATNRFTVLIREPAVVLSENFDSGWLPQGWILEGQNSGSFWRAASGLSPDGIAGSNAWYKGDATASPKLISPVMDLSKCTSNAVLKFWYRNPKGAYTDRRDCLLVYCLDTLLATSPVFNQNGSLETQILPDSEVWRQAVLFLPRLAAGARIIFRGSTTAANSTAGVFVDNVEVLADYGDPFFLAWMTLNFPDGAVSGFYDDPDNDGISNLQEYLKGTDPHDADADNDDLTDGDEAARGTDPTDDDTDNDGLKDGAEVLIHHTDPLKPDTDNDGLSDGDELLHGADPLKPDTDNDGMSDGWEVKHGYPPLIWNDPDLDPDIDGLTNGQESQAGTDPRLIDSDLDGVSDALEIRYGFNPTQWGVYVDSDKDGLPDKLEQAIGTDPNSWDSDGDTMPDGWEFNNGLDPHNAAGADGQGGDLDGDGLSNFDEYINGTSPKNPDTDGDGTPDGTEVTQGSDPRDPSDNGQPPPAGELVEVPFSIGGDYASWEMTIQGLGPIDKRTLKLSTDAPGGSKTKNLKLRKGNSYRITMKWLRSKYSYPDWYCWEAQVGSLPQVQTFENYTNVRKANVAVSLFGDGYYVDNRDGLLSTHTHVKDGQGGNVIGDLSATLYVLKAALVPDYDRDGDISEEKDYLKALSKTPLRFWVNDDKNVGSIASGDSDIPGQSNGNAADASVNGYSDLIDFTPVWLNIKDVIDLLSNELGISYYLSGRNLNFVYTSLMKNNAGIYQTKAGDADEILAKTVNTACVTGTQIPASVINTIKSNPWKGVILIEGKEASSAPLALEVYRNSTLIYKCELSLKISPVEQMYTRVNLRSGTVITPPSNQPDNNGKNVVFLHGFKVDEQSARAWNSAIFKRLHQSGCNAKFWGVTWPSDGGFMDGGFNFHGNVVTAFNTAPSLASVVGNNMTGEKIVMAHSLGNMVVSSAIQDHNMKVAKYFLLNAAVPSEAYDETLVSKDPANPLVHDEWKGYESKTWTSCWHELFDAETDDRGKLTWKNRFPAVAAVAYNYYSLGDEVFELFADRTPIVTDGVLSSLGRYSWHKQESFKGRVISNDNFTKMLYFPSDYSGWGFNSTWILDPLPLEPLKKKYFPKYSATTANAFTPDALRATPVFNPSPSSMLNPVIPISTRNEILCKGVPALSPATGLTSAGSAAKPVFNENVNMQLLPHPNLWWRWDSGELNSRWLHGDLKDAAYFFVHPLFIDLCERGNLK